MERRCAQRSIASALFLSLSLIAPSAHAQSPSTSYRSRLLGVYDAQSAEPIEGVEVSDALNKVSALTTKTGTVSLAFLPEGGTLVRIRKVGYESTTLMVAISPADTVPITVLLARSAQTLPKVVTTDSAPKHISPALNAFEQRRLAGGGGQFITEAELRKNDGGRSTMTNVLRRLPGMTIRCGKAPGPRAFDCWGVAGRVQSKYAILGGECSTELYIDGVPQSDNDLNKLRVDDYAGVEYYAGAAVPALYNRTGSTCGVLLLWSRER